MSTRTDYSADEWSAISTAPAAAGLVIALSDFASPTGVAHNGMIVMRAIARSALGDAPEIVKVLAEGVTRGTTHPALPDLKAADRAHSKEVLITTVRLAVRAIARKSPTEVEPFKAWLASVAAKTCHATHPGNGAMPLSRDKQDTIDRLAAVLGVSRASRKIPQRP